MGGGVSKAGNTRVNNHRGGRHNQNGPPPRGRAAGRRVNRNLDREERPRNTHDDLFSTDPFRIETDTRPIEDLSPRDAYVPAENQRNNEHVTDTDLRQPEPLHDPSPRSLHPPEPMAPIGPAGPAAPVNRWRRREPWLGRDGWPGRQIYPNQRGHYDGYGQFPSHRRYAGYQIARPPRYEDVVRDYGPAPRPERQQPIGRQPNQVPVLLTNQNTITQPIKRQQPDDVNVVAQNSRMPRENMQDVEVESLLSYGHDGDKNIIYNNTRGDAEPKQPIDEDDALPEKGGDVKVFKEDDDEYIGANLRFYRNEIRFRPNGEFIDNIHKYWYGDYQRLEKSQSYIQWLFPLAERSSVNPYALPLQKHETKYIHGDEETKARVVTSYQMMLDFFGMRLVDPSTGELARSDIWRERYSHLKRSGKNYFRITRIIRSLGALGFYLYQAPLAMFLLHEVLETKQLDAVPPGIVNTWLGAVDNTFDREYIRKQFQHQLNDMNNLYEKKNVKIRVQDNVYYDSSGQRQKNGEHVHRHKERYTYARGHAEVEE